MQVYPAAWGWTTIVVTLVTVSFFSWKWLGNRTLNRRRRVLVKAFSNLLPLLCVFAFIQWVEWYK